VGVEVGVEVGAVVGEVVPACSVVKAKVPDTGCPSAEVTRHSTV
jgi:hypothetical protein